MPLLRSTSRGHVETVALEVQLPRPSVDAAVELVRVGEPVRVGNRRATFNPDPVNPYYNDVSESGPARLSIPKRITRQNSRSPYAKPPSNAMRVGDAACELPPLTLSSAMAEMLLGPISTRTRLRRQSFQARSLGGRQQPAGRLSTIPALMTGAPSRMTLPASNKPRRLAPIDPAATARSDPTGHAAMRQAPREARAEERKKRAATSRQQMPCAAPRGTTALSHYQSLGQRHSTRLPAR